MDDNACIETKEADSRRIAMLYVCGYCPEEGGPGGAGAIVVFEDGERSETAEGYARTTVNRMSLRALVCGLSEIPRDYEIVVHTESKYIADAVNGGFIARWRANLWRGEGERPLKNPDLWRSVDWALGETGRYGEILWIERGLFLGGMIRAEALAREAAGCADLKADGCYEGDAGAAECRRLGVSAFDENADPADFS